MSERHSSFHIKEIEESLGENIIRVLYVDDEKDFTVITKEYLEKLYKDMRIDSLIDPTTVIDKLKEKKFDIIVSDYKMGGINGLELLNLLRSQNDNIPFIMFTGRGREEVAIEALNLGADYYIKKGGDPESQYRELGHVIKQVVHHNRTEFKLRESEQKFRLLTEQSLLGIAILQDGVIKYVNEALAVGILGYSIEKMLDWAPNEFAKVIHSEDRKFAVEQAKKKQAGEEDVVVHYQYRVVTKSGQIKWVDNYSKTVIYKGKYADLITIIDITKSKRIEEVFWESEERYRQLFESMSEGLLILDKDNVIIYANDNLCKMYQYSKDELVGSYPANFIDEKSRKIFENQIERRRGTKISPRAIVNDAGEFKGSFGVVTDITELKKAELLLQESEERYRSLFENMPIGLYRSTPEGKTLAANPTMIKMVNYSSIEEIVALNLENKDQYPPMYPREEFKELMGKEGSVEGLESNWRTKDGSIITVRESAIAIRDESGKILYYEGSVEDITEQKIVKKELRESEEKYRKLIDLSPEAITLTDRDYVFIAVNQHAAKLHGFANPKEMIGKSAFELIHQEDHQKALDNARMSLEEESIKIIELNLIKKDGRVFQAELSVSVIVDEQSNPKYFIGITRDITERKNAEKALKESEERYRELFHNATDGIFLFKLNEERMIDAFIEVNETACQLWGYNREEWLTMSPLDILTQHSKNKIPEMAQQYQKTGKLIFEIEFLTKEGKKVAAEIKIRLIKGKKIGLAIIRDINERKQVETALRESEARYRTLFENIPIGLYRTTHDGKILAANPALINMLKYSTFEEFTKLNLEKKEEFPPEYSRQEIKEILERNGKIKGLETDWRTKDGSLITVREHTIAIRDETGNITNYEGSLEDITERKKSEEMLKESEKKFKVLAEKSPNMIFINKKGRILYVNDKCVEITGYTKYDFYSPDFDFLSLIAPEYLDLIKENFRNHMKGEEIESYEYALINKKGERIQTILTSKLIDYEGEKAILGIITDITEHKEAEKALYESEKRFISFMDNLPGVAFIKDSNGRMVYGNKFYKEQYQLNREDWYGKTDEERYPPEVAAQFTETDQQVLNLGLPLEIEQVTNYDGVTRNWLTYKFPLQGEDDSPNMIGGISLEITERKRIEEARKESEEKFRSISESAMVGVAIVQYDKIQYVNEAAARILDLKRDELKKWTLLDIYGAIHPEDKKLVAEQLQKKQIGDKNGIVPHYSARLLTETGDVRWIEVYSKTIVYGGIPADFVIMIDITDRKKAEEELQIKNQAIESSINAIAIASLDGTVIYSNSSLLGMWGYEEEEIIGKISSYEFWENQEKAKKVIQSLSIIESYFGEATAKRKDGSLFEAQVTANLVRNDVGKPICVMASFIDITVRKKAEEELRMQREELSDFAHFIAHDLGNSISTITGYGRLFQRKKDESFIEKMLKQAEYMQKQLDNSLKLADAGRTIDKLSKVEMNDLVDRIADATIPKNVSFSHDVLPKILCDPVKLSQVFKNLFENAMIHGKPNKIAVKLKISDQDIIILVINDGEPLSSGVSNIKEKIFTRGFTTKAGKMGLGLAIVKKLVEAHGWKINVQTNQENTVFQIHVPREIIEK
ncbi:MAG: PAS domain S-box protein [Candidatus Hodarchaeales archaeon]|jgi:PAS domain S-box-containing protein